MKSQTIATLPTYGKLKHFLILVNGMAKKVST
jgi:hypothetical protein